MHEQVEATTVSIPEIHLPAENNKFIRNFMQAVAAALTRANEPGVIVVPDKDRHELRSALHLLAGFVRREEYGAFLYDDEDLVDYVLEETHHRPVFHLKADSITLEMQQRLVDYFTQSSVLRPAVTIFVVPCDPGELMASGTWLKGFREVMHMPTFRWPESTVRLKTPKHRVDYFLEVFQHVGSKYFGVDPKVDPGARDFLQSTFFTQFTPLYTGNYVKLAADLISTMRKFGEKTLTTKVVLTLTAPGHDLALG